MKKSELNSKWENIASFKNKNDYKALRINDTCVPDLFIANDKEGYRNLLLFLPEKVDVKLKKMNKNKLAISFLPLKRIVLIKLKDFDFKDLFDDLILSIYSKINLIYDPIDFSKEFIKTFYKWALFFEDKKEKKLTEEQIQGLFGELFVLIEYIKNSDQSNINHILDSWKGLYDAANDFEFDLKNVEVKSKKESILFVKISSEFQLEKELDKDLELLVVSLKLDLIQGRSLHDMILEIIKLIRTKKGELSILFQALNQKGLNTENLKLYNNYKYIVIKTESFDAGIDNFPKLTISNIDTEVSNLKYKLRVSNLNEFLIEKKTF